MCSEYWVRHAKSGLQKGANNMYYSVDIAHRPGYTLFDIEANTPQEAIKKAQDKLNKHGDYMLHWADDNNDYEMEFSK
jgi:hypothetical protein